MANGGIAGWGVNDAWEPVYGNSYDNQDPSLPFNVLISSDNLFRLVGNYGWDQLHGGIPTESKVKINYLNLESSLLALNKPSYFNNWEFGTQVGTAIVGGISQPYTWNYGNYPVGIRGSEGVRLWNDYAIPAGEIGGQLTNPPTERQGQVTFSAEENIAFD